MNPTNSHQNKVIISMGYDNITTQIDLTTGQGIILPDPLISGSYDLVWWNASDYISPTDDPSAEIVKCIAKMNDTLIVMRSQQQTLASYKNIPGKLYNMILIPSLEELSYYNLPQPHGSTSHTGTIGDHTNLTSIGTNTHAQIDSALTASTNHIAATVAHGVTSAIVGKDDSQLLTNKYIYDVNSFVIAQGLRSATTLIYSASATAPSVGQVLTATGSSSAEWQTPATLQVPQNFTKVISANIRNSNDAQVSQQSTSYVLMKTITLTNGLIGAIRVYFDAFNGPSSYNAIGRIALNGTTLADITCPKNSWNTMSYDITARTFLPGDNIQLWGAQPSSAAYALLMRNFRLAYDNDPLVTVPSTNS